MRPLDFIPKFDLFLAAEGLEFECVVIGATALNLSGVITRETMDCDVLDPEIPARIRVAAEDFAKQERLPENQLRELWLNNGPSTLVSELPSGWRLRVVKAYRGSALSIYTLSREDMLLTKLFALCDRGTDLKDCIAMKPTLQELRGSLSWVQARDAQPDWALHVMTNFRNLAKRLGYEF